jgi:uncharacterized membrane protein YgdD (TMEM256/DUF423 family)
MYRRFLQIGALLGALGVALGAFGVHSLKTLVSAESLNAFETGVRYQFYHCFALLIAAILYRRSPSKKLEWAGIFFISGIILFSGSLYVLTLLDAMDASGSEGFGAVTPLGGLCFILGWIFLMIGVRRSGHNSRSASSGGESK